MRGDKHFGGGLVVIGHMFGAMVWEGSGGVWSMLGLSGTVDCDCLKHCTQIGPSAVLSILIIEPVEDRPGNMVASYLQEEPLLPRSPKG